MWFTKFIPQTFLGRIPLQRGALIVGIFMLSISIICVLSLTVEIALYKQCTECTGLVLYNAYSFSLNAIIYCIMMVFINVWYIWGVRKQKSSVVLSWVVITGMWWAQSFVLVFVLMCVYIAHNTIGWVAALCCAVMAFLIFAYCILVGYGYWLEIRKPSPRHTITIVE